MGGLHAISFYFSIHCVGAVLVAVANGLTTAGGFITIHVFFCGADRSQCIDYSHGNATTWNKWQKPVAITLSLLGMATYSLGKGSPGAAVSEAPRCEATGRETYYEMQD